MLQIQYIYISISPSNFCFQLNIFFFCDHDTCVKRAIFHGKKFQVEEGGEKFISNWPPQQKYLPGGHLKTFSSFVFLWFRYTWQLDKFQTSILTNLAQKYKLLFLATNGCIACCAYKARLLLCTDAH